jgi:hypothetical protein
VLISLLVAVACKDPVASVAVEAGAPTTTAGPTPTPTPTREPVQVAPPPSDGGVAGCATVVAPTRLSRPGPFALIVRSGGIAAYVQDQGNAVLAGELDGAGKVTAQVDPGAKFHLPPCAAAGTYAYCMSPQGELHRFQLAGKDPQRDGFAAHARPGTPLAATFASGHSVVAYLRDHTTTEGTMTEAFVAEDDGAELHLSDDGAGATTIALAPRADGALAVYVDARRAMSPVHARTISMSPKLTLGKDVVLFVAGSAEPYTRAAVGASPDSAWVLMPIAHDLGFGLAVIKVAGEPQMDAPVAWSDYPNGLDPAPVAATLRDAHTVYVARVRPSAPTYGSPKVLELGRADETTGFAPFGVIPTQGAPLDVALENVGADVVLAYTDAAGGWIERLRCASR